MRLASAADVGHRGRGRPPRRGRRLAHGLAQPSGPRCCSRSASCSHARADELAEIITRRARQGASPTPSARCSGGSRSSSSRAASATAQGRLHRAGVRPASTSTRSASRSASPWPASPRSTSRPWCRCGCSRSPSRAATPSCSSRPSTTRRRRCCWRRAVAEAGPARRRLQRAAGRQGGGRRAAHPPAVERRQLRRLHPDRAVRLRDGHRCRQAGAGPRRRQEPHGRPARRRPRPGRRRGGQRGLRLGGRAVHGHLGGRGRRPGRRRAGRRDRRADRAR